MREKSYKIILVNSTPATIMPPDMLLPTWGQNIVIKSNKAAHQDNIKSKVCRHLFKTRLMERIFIQHSPHKMRYNQMGYAYNCVRVGSLEYRLSNEQW